MAQNQIINQFPVNNQDELLEQIENILSRTDQQFAALEPEAILLLGSSGEGKSTLLNALAGKQLLKETTIYGDEMYKCTTPLPGSEISSSQNVSCTRFPNQWNGIWDCPGFDDTGNQELSKHMQEIKNAYAISRVAGGREKVRIILTVSENTILYGRPTKFLDTLKFVAEIFQSSEDLENGLLLVLTKTKRLSVNLFQRKLQEIQNDWARENLFAGQKQRQILEFLAGPLASIALFHDPSSQNYEQILIEDIDVIKRSINCLQWLIRPSPKISLNESSLLLLERIAYRRILGFINEICRLIRDHAEQLDFDSFFEHMIQKMVQQNGFTQFNQLIDQDIFGVNRSAQGNLVFNIEKFCSVPAIIGSNLPAFQRIICKVSQIMVLTQLCVQYKNVELQRAEFDEGALDTVFQNIHQKIEQNMICSSQMNQNLNIFNQKYFIIDQDIERPGETLTINSTIWVVLDQRKINLKGRDGIAHAAHQASQDEEGNGLNGQQGETGQNGGSLKGQIARGISMKNLQIDLCGGNGGQGQNGGNGKNGEDAGEGEGVKPIILSDARLCGLLRKIPKTLAKRQINANQTISKKMANLFTKNSQFIETFQCYQEGQKGKNAGRGGLGGKGGKPGACELNFLGEEASAILMNEGNSGAEGQNGQPGRGGKNGPLYRGVKSAEYFLGKERNIEIFDNQQQAQGIDYDSMIKMLLEFIVIFAKLQILDQLGFMKEMTEKIKYVGENRFLMNPNNLELLKLPNIDLKNFISKAFSEFKIQIPKFENWVSSSRELYKEGRKYFNLQNGIRTGDGVVKSVKKIFGNPVYMKVQETYEQTNHYLHVLGIYGGFQLIQLACSIASAYANSGWLEPVAKVVGREDNGYASDGELRDFDKI